MGRTPLEALVRFCRLASEVRFADEALDLLAADAVDLLGVAGAAVVRIHDTGEPSLAASRGLPAGFQWVGKTLDVGGPELGERLLRASGGRFSAADTLPLIAGGDLYGTLVLLRDDEADLPEDKRALAEALADLSAIALNRSAQDEALARSHAEIASAQEGLARSEKIHALGQMASGIAHDLRNVLNPLVLNLDLLRRRVGKDPGPVAELLDRLDEAVRCGIATVERVRVFSRQDPQAPPKMIEVDHVVSTAIDLVRPRIDQQPGMVLVSRLGAPSGVRLRGDDLVMALVNLLANAVESMPSGGEVAVATGHTDGRTWVEVADTGPGMSAEVAARVFEPFFTTKKVGTGLGLAMVASFVRHSGGEVELDTVPSRGTRVRLWFPARPGA